MDKKVGFFLDGDSEPRGFSSTQDFRRHVRPIVRRPGGPIGVLRQNLIKLGLIHIVTIWEGSFVEVPDLNFAFVFCDATHTRYEISKNLPPLCRLLHQGAVVAFHDTDANNRREIERYLSFQETIQVDSLFIGKVLEPICDESTHRIQAHSKYLPVKSQPTDPTVSVILPTYDRAHLLPRAILSILNQTYEDFELIIVDDASTDETGQVISAFQDARVRYLRHEHNQGLAAARNTGIQAAQGQLIAFQDSDDEWLPEKLALQLNTLAQSPEDIGVVYTQHRLIRQDGKIGLFPSRFHKVLQYLPFEIYRQNGDILLALSRGNLITSQSVLLKRECIEKTGLFDERLYRLQDWDLWLRLAQYYRFSYIPQPLVNVYVTEGNLSTNTEAGRQALEIILQKHKNQGHAGRLLQAHYQFATGDLLCQKGDYREGKKRLWRAILLSPFNLTYWEAALFSLFGREFYTMMVERLKIGYSVR
jgi:glycosyltransferase involved in cell wall biosynthesis